MRASTRTRLPVFSTLFGMKVDSIDSNFHNHLCRPRLHILKIETGKYLSFFVALVAVAAAAAERYATALVWLPPPSIHAVLTHRNIIVILSLFDDVDVPSWTRMEAGVFDREKIIWNAIALLPRWYVSRYVDFEAICLHYNCIWREVVRKVPRPYSVELFFSSSLVARVAKGISSTADYRQRQFRSVCVLPGRTCVRRIVFELNSLTGLRLMSFEVLSLRYGSERMKKWIKSIESRQW